MWLPTMDTPLKARNASKSLHRSPSSVTEIKNGSLVVSEEALGHIQDMFHAGLIPNLPEPLPFVNPNTPE